MAAASWLIRTRVRRRALAMVPLALIVAAGATGTLVALGAAHRTMTAYDRYLRRADVGNLQINPSLSTAEIDHVIRTLPGVRSVTTHDLLNVSAAEGLSTAGDQLEGNGAQIRGSVDGRYITMDRPALRAGRLPTGHREAIVNVEMAKQFHVGIGDVVALSFVSTADQLAAEEAGDPNAQPSPEGVERVTVVGIATLPDEVLPDGLYPRQRMVVSPDVTARYDCPPRSLPSHASYADLLVAVFPGRCAISYRYYSLAVDGGERGVAAAQDAFVRRGTQLNAELPQSLKERGVGYSLIPTITAKDRARVDRATQPTVTALAVLGMSAGVVTAVVAGLAVARELRRDAETQLQLWRLGLTTGERARVVAAPMLLAVATGLAAALSLAWWLSPLGPVGNVRALEPSPSRMLSPWVWRGGLTLAVVLGAGVVTLAFSMSRRVGRPAAPRRDISVVARIVRGSAGTEVGEGIRAAFGGDRGAGVVVASGAIATSLLVTAVVFGASLSTLISTPRSYGWPWDVAVMSGFGYGGLHVDAVEASLGKRRDVDRWTTLAFTNSVAVDGEPVPSMIGLGRGSKLDFALADGRLPVADDEVALGAKTAARHGVGVGDRVKVGGDNLKPRRATVTGLTVLPALGPFESDRASPGDGMVLPAAMFDANDLAGLATFVGIDVAHGTDRATTLAAIRRDYKVWGADIYTVDFVKPVRPAEIVDAQGVRSIPLLVGGLLGVSVVVGLALVVAASVRGRRHELAILRALGFTGRQLRGSVRIQSVATMIAALAFGLPVGVALGRVVWRLFASRLAVVQPPSIPALGILATSRGCARRGNCRRLRTRHHGGPRPPGGVPAF